MFVSGVHPAVDVAKLIRLAGRPLTDLDRRVEAGHGALDTGGNAAETAAWMREHGYRSLRLVTGNYHMPRSLFEFRIALPSVEVIPHPVFPYSVQRSTWWLRPGTAALIIGEYNKYLLASLGHWAGYRLCRRLAARRRMIWARSVCSRLPPSGRASWLCFICRFCSHDAG